MRNNDELTHYTSLVTVDMAPEVSMDVATDTIAPGDAGAKWDGGAEGMQCFISCSLYK